MVPYDKSVNATLANLYRIAKYSLHTVFHPLQVARQMFVISVEIVTLQVKWCARTDTVYCIMTMTHTWC